MKLRGTWQQEEKKKWADARLRHSSKRRRLLRLRVTDTHQTHMVLQHETLQHTQARQQQQEHQKQQQQKQYQLRYMGRRVQVCSRARHHHNLPRQTHPYLEHRHNSMPPLRAPLNPHRMAHTQAGLARR